MVKKRSATGIDCVTCPVKRLCIPATLTLTENEIINNSIQFLKTADKGEHIFRIKDPLREIYAVRSGSCKDYWIDENGNERIDNFYFPGDIIGLESIAHENHLFSLIALEPSQLCIIPIEALYDLMHQHKNLAKRMMHIASYKMQNDYRARINNSAEQRIADFLLNILARLQERKHDLEHISLPMSQVEISNFLHMAHETVNRILHKLQNDQIIKIERRQIYVTDAPKLKKISAFEGDFGQLPEQPHP